MEVQGSRQNRLSITADEKKCFLLLDAISHVDCDPRLTNIKR